MTFKNGNRVRMTADHDGRRADTDGVVMKTNPGGTSYLVKFDPPFKGYGENGRCWNVSESKLALAGVRLEAGKSYVTRDGRTVAIGPNDGRFDPTYAFAGTYAEGGGSAWMADGRYWNTGRGEDRGDIVSEAPAAESYKVGDRVRMADDASHYAGHDVTIEQVDKFDESLPYSVTVGDGDWNWVTAKDIAGVAVPEPAPAQAVRPAALHKVGDLIKIRVGADYFSGKTVKIERVDEDDDLMPYFVEFGDDSRWIHAVDVVGPVLPKVGDWVYAGGGRVGIVFHDDGCTALNLHVGIVASGGTIYCSAGDLTVVPAGTSAADNDNFKVGDLLEVVDISSFDKTRVRVGDIAKKVSGGSYEFPANYRTRGAANAFTQIGSDSAFKRHVAAR